MRLVGCFLLTIMCLALNSGCECLGTGVGNGEQCDVPNGAGDTPGDTAYNDPNTPPPMRTTFDPWLAFTSPSGLFSVKVPDLGWISTSNPNYDMTISETVQTSLGSVETSTISVSIENPLTPITTLPELQSWIETNNPCNYDLIAPETNPGVLENEIALICPIQWVQERVIQNWYFVSQGKVITMEQDVHDYQHTGRDMAIVPFTFVSVP